MCDTSLHLCLIMNLLHLHACITMHKGFCNDASFYCHAGNSWDLSSAVMDRALMHADCVYKFPAQRVRGHMCKTNIASNTAFRGFGGPQVCLLDKHCSCQVFCKLFLAYTRTLSMLAVLRIFTRIGGPWVVVRLLHQVHLYLISESARYFGYIGI